MRLLTSIENLLIIIIVYAVFSVLVQFYAMDRSTISQPMKLIPSAQRSSCFYEKFSQSQKQLLSTWNQFHWLANCRLGWALFSKYILLIFYFKDLILLILMVCFFLHITYRNLVEFSFL